MGDRVVTIRLRESSCRRLVSQLDYGSPEGRKEIRKLLVKHVEPKWLQRHNARLDTVLRGRPSKGRPKKVAS